MEKAFNNACLKSNFRRFAKSVFKILDFNVVEKI